MSTPLIPKLFVQHAAGGQYYLAERLWNTPHPKLWGRTPAELWNNKDSLPLNTVALRGRILNAFTSSRTLAITPTPVQLPVMVTRAPEVPEPFEPDAYHKGNGKTSKVLTLEQWEALFGDIPQR